ncbi:MAG: hypothetical protein AB8G16_13930 [Gammaproteobacteria bacterium]
MTKRRPVDPALRDEALDQMGQTIVTLAKELWLMRDRQLMLEAQLREHGIPVNVDATPTPEVAEQLSTEREAFVEKFLASLVP